MGVAENTCIPLFSGGEPNAPEALHQLVARAGQCGASDIHLQLKGDTAEVSFRLDGVLTPQEPLPAGLAERVFGRIKFLGRLKTYQESLPQEGRINQSELGTGSDLRVATYPTVTGEKIVLRLFRDRAIAGLETLGFPAAVVQQLERFLACRAGMLLLTGPAGSGKTTTIYSCLARLAGMQRHVITVEDPVERVVPGIMQTELNEPLGLTFAAAARYLLRQDPEVLVIGEIRDEETAGIALRAALTGHLVVSTLHAGSCRGVLQRLNVLCREPSAVAACLELILNQRLVRRVCPGCAGRGCAECVHTGFRGRVPIVESLPVSDVLRTMILQNRLETITAQPDLWEQGRALVQSGQTTGSELQRVLGLPPVPTETATGL